MTERLTQRDKERGFAWSGYSLTDIVNKLAHYEDLEERCLEEYSFAFRTLMWKWSVFYKDIDQFIKWRDLQEQGRLIVLPEGFQKEKFINYMANKHCPSNFGFKDENRLQGRCAGGKECEECWGKVLEGENYEGCDQ